MSYHVSVCLSIHFINWVVLFKIPTDLVTYNGHQYLFQKNNFSNRYSFASAEEMCQSLNGNLLQVDDEAEWTFVGNQTYERGMMRPSKIGGQLDADGNWVKLSGT